MTEGASYPRFRRAWPRTTLQIRSSVVLSAALLTAVDLAPRAEADGIYWTTSTGAVGKANISETPEPAL